MSREEFNARVGKAAQGSDIEDMTKISPTDPAIRQALTDYAAGGGYAANGQLRKLAGNKSAIKDEYPRDVADGMDRALEGRGLGRDAVVMRGISDPAVTFGGREPVVGMEWTDHGFVSTSASGRAAGMFTGTDYEMSGGVEMRILVPKGTNAISSDRLIYDNEVVLDRGLTFRVVADRGVDFDGVRQLDVEVKP